MSNLTYLLGAVDVCDESVADRSLSRRSVYMRKVCPVVATCLYYSGLVPLVRWWTHRSGPRLTILGYHRASRNLRQHILYLQRHYRILPLEAALEELYGSRTDGLRQMDRRPPLVLTFDDGYYDNYTDAFALACELRVPFTVFLCPGYIDDARRFWWFEGTYLARHAKVNQVAIEGHTYHLDRREEREVLAHAIDTRLRHAPSVAEREAFLVSTRGALGVPVPAHTTSEDQPACAFGWPQAREMEASGWVTFGAHTTHHPVLSCLSDPAEVQDEVRECRVALERQLGHVVHAFAYPMGGLEDIGDHGLDAVREVGYNWAVTTVPGFNTPDTDPHLLRRILMDTSEHWSVMVWELAEHQLALAWKSFSASVEQWVAEHVRRRFPARRRPGTHLGTRMPSRAGVRAGAEEERV